MQVQIRSYINKENSMRKNLTQFFCLLISFSFFLFLFNLIFNWVYHQNYKNIIQQMTSIDKYYDSLSQLHDNMGLYTHYKDEAYFSNVLSSAELANLALDEISASQSTYLILQETADLSEMTESLLEQIEQQHAIITQTSEIDNISSIRRLSQNIETSENIYQAINDEYREINHLVVAFISDTYRSMQKKSLLFLVAFFILFSGICAIMLQHIRILSLDIYRPLSDLTRQAIKIRNDGLIQTKPVEISVTAPDEIRTLAEMFNEMIQKIKEQICVIEENSRVRQLLAESRYKELQLQINPHFLFNTLNMISESAYLENAMLTEQLLVSAAKMFRFSLDFSGKIISLRQELKELENYIFIQRHRFNDLVSFQLDTDESAGFLKIPSFVFQPLVENALVHGIDHTVENSCVLIRTRFYPERSSVCLSVADNGRGMSSDKLKAVRNNMENFNECSTKIGLGNVFLRLKLFTDGKAKMSLLSSPGNGTEVTIWLPYTQEEKHAQIDNCR